MAERSELAKAIFSMTVRAEKVDKELAFGKDLKMEDIKTIEELLKMSAEEVKAYLWTLPAEDRRRLAGKLLEASLEKEIQQVRDNLGKNAPK